MEKNQQEKLEEFISNEAKYFYYDSSAQRKLGEIASVLTYFGFPYERILINLQTSLGLASLYEKKEDVALGIIRDNYLISKNSGRTALGVSLRREEMGEPIVSLYNTICRRLKKNSLYSQKGLADLDLNCLISLAKDKNIPARKSTRKMVADSGRKQTSAEARKGITWRQRAGNKSSQ